jgi:hypothetical protein
MAMGAWSRLKLTLKVLCIMAELTLAGSAVFWSFAGFAKYDENSWPVAGLCAGCAVALFGFRKWLTWLLRPPYRQTV